MQSEGGQRSLKERFGIPSYQSLCSNSGICQNVSIVARRGGKWLFFQQKPFHSCFAQHRERYRTHSSHCDSQIFYFPGVGVEAKRGPHVRKGTTFTMLVRFSWGNLPPDHGATYQIPDLSTLSAKLLHLRSPSPRLRLLGGKKTTPTWKSGSLSGKAVF